MLWATVSDRSDVPGYEIDRAVSVDARSSTSWRSQGACSKRGVFTLGPWSVLMGDPIGLFQVEIKYPEVRQLLVYPRVMRLPDLDLPRGRAGGRSRRSTAAPVQSVLPRTVRPYIPGDSLRLVHWRKSAQKQELMIKEFDLEPACDLWLVLDMDASVQAGADQESTLEYDIILTASLAASHLNENRGVGLIVYGEQALRVPPHADRGHLWQLLHGLANAEPSHDWPLARVLKQVGPDIGRGRTMIVITPSTESEWLGELLQLGRRDVASSALLVDAASFDTTRNGRLESLQHILSDHGVPNHVIAKGYPFRPLVTIKRKRKVLKTLSGTGRVIVVEIIEQGGLPRSHLLGAAPELGRKLAMFVRTSDPAAGSEIQANYRWRGITFSDYLGRGWENPQVIETVRYTPGESWLAISEQGRRSIRQSFDFVGDRPTWLYALGEPIAADRSYTAHYRQPHDIIGLEVRARDYTVISQILAVSEAKLRSLPAPVSDSLAGYLTLPDTTPNRVKTLAREVTAEAETPYDQAKALEAYLRGYPYNLDILDLPEHVVDIADYFLFDLQQGYCDYYATTMVVMARIGLPARLAIGYAAGFYDNERNRFAVTEADAHSWPEIYFPAYGWIPCEPTAAQPTYVREPDSGLDSVDTAAAQLDFRAEIDDLRRQAWLYRGAWRWGVALSGLALTMLLIRFAGREWRLRRRAANP